MDFQFLDLPENAVFYVHREEGAFGTIRQVRKHGSLCCSPWGCQAQSIA